MKEITKWDNNPRKMWVWNDFFDDKQKAKVIYIADRRYCHFPVMTISEKINNYCPYKHCAEIEEPKTRRYTNQELAWWLLEGVKDCKHREWKLLDNDYIFCFNDYRESEANQSVPESLVIRENGGEWHEPLVMVEE